MLVKLLSTLFLLLSITSSCFAFANTTITNVTKKEVTDYIVNEFARNAPNWILESASDYGINYIVTQPLKNAFGMQVGSQQNKISFITSENGENTILTVNEVATAYSNFGGMNVQAINDTASHMALVARIRQHFNDCYLFGFDISSKKKDGGYVITSVSPGSPFENALIKVGDIVLKYNGVKVTKLKNEFLYGSCFDKFRQTTAVFEIMHNGAPKTYNITSKLYKCNYQKPPVSQSKVDASQDSGNKNN